MMKARASERDVSLLTNRTAPTRYESVGCDERNFSSSEELRLVAPSAEVRRSQWGTINDNRVAKLRGDG